MPRNLSNLMYIAMQVNLGLQLKQKRIGQPEHSLLAATVVNNYLFIYLFIQVALNIAEWCSLGHNIRHRK